MFDLKTRVLVVDDMFAMRKLVMKVCKEIGFTDVSEAADGALAWTAIQSSPTPFGLVISDWNMPNSTGLDLLKRIRSDAKYKSLPFLMVTAEAENHQVVEAVKSGVTSYVVKPFSKDILKEKLESMQSSKAG